MKSRRRHHAQRLAVVLGAQVQQEWHGGAAPFVGARVTRSRAAETALQHVGVDDSGIERHGGHPARKLLREGLRQTFDGPFRRAIGGDFGIRRAPPTGAEIDDYALPALYHRRREMANDVHHAFDIDVDHLRELSGADLPKRGVLVDDRGIVQKQVGRAM